MNFINDPELGASLQRLTHNADFQYLLKSLGVYYNQLSENLIANDDPEIRGVLKHFLKPFLEQCGSVDYAQANILEQSKRRAMQEYELLHNGHRWVDNEL